MAVIPINCPFCNSMIRNYGIYPKYYLESGKCRHCDQIINSELNMTKEKRTKIIKAVLKRNCVDVSTCAAKCKPPKYCDHAKLGSHGCWCEKYEVYASVLNCVNCPKFIKPIHPKIDCKMLYHGFDGIQHCMRSTFFQNSTLCENCITKRYVFNKKQPPKIKQKIGLGKWIN